jgi:hypothetical protein
LPAGWSNILDEIQMRLDHAVASADARIADAVNHDSLIRIDQRHEEIAAWSSRLQRLRAFLDSADQVVRSVDEVLAQEETRLRQQIATSACVRQKLADEAGRAIG